MDSKSDGFDCIKLSPVIRSASGIHQNASLRSARCKASDAAPRLSPKRSAFARTSARSVRNACKAFRIGPDANFRDRSGVVARQGQHCLAWRTAVPQTRCRKHSSRSSCSFRRDLSTEQSSGRQFPDLRAIAESGNHTRSARDTVKEDDHLAVSRNAIYGSISRTRPAVGWCSNSRRRRPEPSIWTWCATAPARAQTRYPQVR